MNTALAYYTMHYLQRAAQQDLWYNWSNKTNGLCTCNTAEFNKPPPGN